MVASNDHHLVLVVPSSCRRAFGDWDIYSRLVYCKLPRITNNPQDARNRILRHHAVDLSQKEDTMFIALLMGVVAGLRTLTPLAAVSWAARLGILNLNGTWLAFLGNRWSPWLFSLIALGELVYDKLPTTPSRTIPIQFASRIITGTFAAFAIGSASGTGIPCALSGSAGAVIGTLAGSAARRKLVQWLGGRDFPIALLEDCIALGSAVILVRSIV
jgi:uncharacterized membrane protein